MMLKSRELHPNILLPHQEADLYGQKKKKAKSEEEEDRDWLEKYGAKGAKTIRQTVNANVKDYEYLKQFALTA